jgi:hypothetical protein
LQTPNGLHVKHIPWDTGLALDGRIVEFINRGKAILLTAKRREK